MHAYKLTAPILDFSLFAVKKARAVGRNVGSFNLFIKVGNTRSVVLSCNRLVSPFLFCNDVIEEGRP